MAWGALTVENNARKWTLAYEQFSHEPPEQDLISFYDFLEMEYELKSRPEGNETVEQMNEYNQHLLAQKKEKLVNFARPGNPGSKFKSQVEKLNRATYLPKNVREDLGMNDLADDKTSKRAKSPRIEEDEDLKEEKEKEAEGEGDNGEGDEHPPTAEVIETDEEKMIKLFEGQKYHLLPSFFKTLIYLKKAKREFAIVLRGEEEFIKPVIFEFNKFCIGEHPCFCGRSGTPTIKFDGSKGTKYCIIDDQ